MERQRGQTPSLIENGLLRFSVTDDGNGFDPASAPGIRSGHFGLQGIRERIKRLRGTFTLDSAIGRGTKATVTLRTSYPS